MSQRPPTVTRVEEEEEEEAERGDLGAERAAGSVVGGLRSSRDTWDVLGAPGVGVSPMDHPGRGAGGGKATCDREEDEVTLGKGTCAVTIPIPPQRGGLGTLRVNPTLASPEPTPWD